MTWPLPLRWRLLLYGRGVLVGPLCVQAGWQHGQWSLVLLGLSQVVLWLVTGMRAIRDHRFARLSAAGETTTSPTLDRDG